MTVVSFEGRKLAEIRVGKLAMNVCGLVLGGVCLAASFLVARLLPHFEHAAFSDWQCELAVLGIVVLFPVHEALHGLALKRAGIAGEHIRYGVLWSALAFYCHTELPVSVMTCRRVLLLPLWVTGGITGAILLLLPSDGSAILLSTAISACIGDLMLYQKLRPFGGDARVHDIASAVGFDVYAA